MESQNSTLLCISTYEKGQRFLRQAAAEGVDVVLITTEKLRDADWPRDVLAEFHTVPEPEVAEHPDVALLKRVVEGICRRRRVGRIVPLDEFDLLSAAELREHLRLPGLGFSATCLFRDKLAMRGGAAAAGVAAPEFTGVFHDADLLHFMANTEGPWLLKPRWSASAIGIQKIREAAELWPALDRLGERRAEFLLERFVPGEIFHVEGITSGGELLFASPHKYGQPPLETMHVGGIFSTRTLPRESDETRELLRIHAATLQALGMRDGVTHSEFIRAYGDGGFRFLETAARVGGAYIADVVEHESGLNPWAEWARLEVAAMRRETYRLPEVKPGYAGSVICLARQEQPDLSGYHDAEVVYRLNKHHHAGLIVRSERAERVEELLREYSRRFLTDFYARMDAPDRPTA